MVLRTVLISTFCIGWLLAEEGQNPSHFTPAPPHSLDEVARPTDPPSPPNNTGAPSCQEAVFRSTPFSMLRNVAQETLQSAANAFNEAYKTPEKNRTKRVKKAIEKDMRLSTLNRHLNSQLPDGCTMGDLAKAFRGFKVSDLKSMLEGALSAMDNPPAQTLNPLLKDAFSTHMESDEFNQMLRTFMGSINGTAIRDQR